jgi:solute carrier family 25, member 39/40
MDYCEFKIAALVTVPFDVIKTHRQIELGEALTRPEGGPRPSSSTWMLIGQLYQNQGISALFAGKYLQVID